MKRPVVLVTPDTADLPSRRGPIPHHVLERWYGDAVLQAGGIPWVLPYTDDVDVLSRVVETCDAVVLTGGAFDIDPALFDAEPHPKLGTLKPDRTAFERSIYELALALGKPLLGICGGMQLINALRGGSLWQDLGSEHPEAMDHEQDPPKTGPGHPVEIVDAAFRTCVGPGDFSVNSTHHQAIRTLAPDLIPMCVAPDGIVEAFRSESGPFLWAVQWHPEAMDDPRHLEIYRALVDAARA